MGKQKQGDMSRAFIVLLALTGSLTLTPASMIDPDTPSVARAIGSASGLLGAGPEGYQLVFSDEFNTAGRQFGAGEDEHWTAINSYNFATGDFEAYVPDAVTTRDGKLRIATDKDIVLDPSGSPRAFGSGMLQSWNKTCFTGGVVEVAFTLPGKVNTSSQLWAAAWLSGMLGRPGFGPPTGVLDNGDLWPWSYNKCDSISADQKYSSCAATVPKYCVARNLSVADCEVVTANKKLLGSEGRGMTEIDIFELFTSISYQTVTDTKAALSTSYQVAPNTDGEAWSSWDSNSECFNTVYKNCRTAAYTPSSATTCNGPLAGYYKCAYPYSVGNTYHGEAGRDSISALTPLTEADFEQSLAMRLVWEPDSELGWYIKRPSDTEWALMLTIPKAALGACGGTGERLIPNEPQYMLFNTAMSDQAGWVHMQDPELWNQAPYEFAVDYVRVYQLPSKVSTTCSTNNYPNDAYVAANPTVFENPDPTKMSVACTSTCGNGTQAPDWAQGIYSYHDTRCPAFGAIYTSGCTPPYENLCRECFTRSAFISAAFTGEGVYGNNSQKAGDTAAPSSKPICPPCVCEKWGLNASQCAVETLPSATSCSNLEMKHPVSGVDLGVKYCSNGNRTSSSGQGPSGTSRSIGESMARKLRQPKGEQLRKHSRQPRPGKRALPQELEPDQ